MPKNTRNNRKYQLCRSTWQWRVDGIELDEDDKVDEDNAVVDNDVDDDRVRGIPYGQLRNWLHISDLITNFVQNKKVFSFYNIIVILWYN